MSSNASPLCSSALQSYAVSVYVHSVLTCKMGGCRLPRCRKCEPIVTALVCGRSVVWPLTLVVGCSSSHAVIPCTVFPAGLANTKAGFFPWRELHDPARRRASSQTRWRNLVVTPRKSQSKSSTTSLSPSPSPSRTITLLETTLQMNPEQGNRCDVTLSSYFVL